MADKFTDWNNSTPYVQATEMLSIVAQFVAAGGEVKYALEQLDEFQIKANTGLANALNHWRDEWGDPDIFYVSHWHGMRIIRWTRARMFFRAVLNWEPPEEKLPSYGRPAVYVSSYETAIWN